MISKQNSQILLDLIEFDRNVFAFYANLCEIFKNKFFEKIAEFRLNFLQTELNFIAENGFEFEFSQIQKPNLDKNLQKTLDEALNLEKNSVLFYENLIKKTKSKAVKELLFQAQAMSYNEILPILKICYENLENLNLNQNEFYQNILNLIENKDKFFDFNNLENFVKTAFDDITKKFFKYILDKQKN